jgi:hypothetical protein
MEDKEIQQRWPEIKKKIKEDFPYITDEELRSEIGKEKEHLEALQVRLGKNWKEIKNWLSLMG